MQVITPLTKGDIQMEELIREPSFMIVIPMNEKDTEDPEIFMENIKDNEHVQIKNMNFDDERGMVITFDVDGTEYDAEVGPTKVEIPGMVRPEHTFTEEEYKRLDEAKTGLYVCIDFEGDNNKCFHDQLKIIDAMFPDVLAVLDCPSEKLLSGKWVSLAANSKVLPAPRYLFTVQAISDGGDEVWLHTHGLKRCGLYELEILNSNKDCFADHYKMIESFAVRMLESEELIEPGEGVFVGQAAGKVLTLTALDWKEALNYYPDVTLGTEEDRDDGVHGEGTYVLMIYRNQEEENNRIYTPVQDFNQFLDQNPMYMFSTDETRRMSSLAIERLPYLLDAYKSGMQNIIVKVGLLTDKEYWDSEDKPEREHIWFELKDVNEDSIVAELTQEPYYVSGIKEGDIRTIPFSDITDWIIFTDDHRITPDDAYLLT